MLEGRLLASPSPAPDHNFAAAELLVQLRPQVPDYLEVIPDVGVDLELVDPDQPGFSAEEISSSSSEPRADESATRAG